MFTGAREVSEHVTIVGFGLVVVTSFLVEGLERRRIKQHGFVAAV